MDLRQLHQLKCELLKVYRYQGLTLQELLCEFYSHINEVINSTNGLIDIVDYLVGKGLSNEVATHLNQMLIDGTFDEIISNKVDELSTNLNNQFNEMKKIIESNILESNNLIENLKIYDSRFNNIENKNIEQDTRLKDIEYRNKVQDVYINGLFNENKDGRLSVEVEGNDLKLEGSKQGLVEVDKVVGNTFVNIANNTFNRVSDSIRRMDIKNLLKTDTTYTIISTLDTIKYQWAILNSSKTILGYNNQKVLTFTTDTSNIMVYIRFNTNETKINVAELYDKIMILEGDFTNKPIPTQHIEGLKSSFEENLVTEEMVEQGLESEENLGKYKVPINVIGENKFERTTNVYLNSPLLEGDEIVMKDGELCHYHKCYEDLLSNLEGAWDLYHTDNINQFYINFDKSKHDAVNPYIVCDKFKTGSINNREGNYETIYTYSNGIAINTLVANTSVEFQTWIQNNPIRIVYKLKEPYYEPIQSDKLLLECANDSTLHIDTVVPVESVKASYTGNVPSVYAMQETGITNTEDIAVTQTAVDFLLMSSMGESLMISFLNNVKGINNLGKYFASRIIKKALSYDDVINKYPQFKNDIDTILLNEGYEYFIK